MKQLAGMSAAHLFTHKIEAFLEEYLTGSGERGTVPFGGRDPELRALDSWLADQAAPARLLVSAPTGRGKSALLVQWITQIAGKGWELVFVPISMRFRTNSPQVFYEAMAARLAQIVGMKVAHRTANRAEYYEDRCRELLSMAIRQKLRVLVVIDGIDEALGEEFREDWFPRTAAGTVRLVVSARQRVWDRGAEGWLGRLGWSDQGAARTLNLPRLDFSAVQDLLVKAGAPVDALADRWNIVRKLLELTEGEPLLLRFYVEDLWKSAREADRLNEKELQEIQPGFQGYFRHWIQRHWDAWMSGSGENASAIVAYLAILANAFGPLSSDELNELLERAYGPKPTWPSMQATLTALRRFLVGTGERFSLERDEGFVLSHPRLGQFLREEKGILLPHDHRAANEAFSGWGREIVAALNGRTLPPSEVPVYLLQYLGAHFEAAGAHSADLMSLVDGGWREAWFAVEGGYRGFSDDVSRALQRLRQDGRHAHIGEEIRCILCLSSIRTLGAHASGGLLAQAVACKVLTARQAVNLIALKPQPQERADALRALAAAVDEPDMPILLEGLKRIGDEYISACTFSEMAGRIGPKSLAPALAYARSIADAANRAIALGSLARQSPEAAHEALKTARQIDKGEPGSVAEVLGEIGGNLPTPLISEALSLAEEIAARASIASALAALVAGAPDALLPRMVALARRARDQASALEAMIGRVPEIAAEALQAVLRIEKPFDRSWSLYYLTPKIPKELLPHVLTAAREISDPSDRIRALSRVVRRMPEVGGEELQLLRKTERVGGVLWLLTPELPVSLVPEAMEIARRHDELMKMIQSSEEWPEETRDAIGREILDQLLKRKEDAFRRAQALGIIAPYLTVSLLAPALEVAVGIEDAKGRAHALTRLLPRLTGDQRIRAESAAVSAAARIKSPLDRAAAFGEIANHADGKRRADLVRRALDAAQRIGDNTESAKVFCRLVAWLPELTRDALEHANRITAPFHRAWALTEIATHASDVAKRRALARRAFVTARGLRDHGQRAEALAKLAALPPGLLPDRVREAADKKPDPAPRAKDRAGKRPSLARTRRIGNPYERALAIAELLPDAPELMKEALQAAGKIDQYEWDTLAWDREYGQRLVEAMAKIVAKAPKEALPLAQEFARGLPDLTERAAVFTHLAMRVPEAAGEALEALREMPVRYKRDENLASSMANAFEQLVPVLPEPLLGEALELARAMEFSADQVAALGTFIPRVPGMVQEAVGLTCHFFEREDFQNAVCNLSPYLSEAARLALEAACHLDHVDSRAEALRDLTGPPRETLSYAWAEDELSEAEKQIRRSEDSLGGDDFLGVAALIEVTPKLPPELLTRALKIAEGIRNVSSRTWALSEIASWLPLALRSDAIQQWITAAQDVPRQKVLEQLTTLLPVIAETSDQHAMETILRSVRNVTSWWP